MSSPSSPSRWRPGQIVMGPPGSGKSTYCDGMQQFLRGVGRRVAVVNLDPANESATYDCAVDVRELVSVERVMDEMKLGPNGATIYCMEYLEKNVDWLEKRLAACGGSCEITFSVLDVVATLTPPSRPPPQTMRTFCSIVRDKSSW